MNRWAVGLTLCWLCCTAYAEPGTVVQIGITNHTQLSPYVILNNASNQFTGTFTSDGYTFLVPQYASACTSNDQTQVIASGETNVCNFFFTNLVTSGFTVTASNITIGAPGAGDIEIGIAASLESTGAAFFEMHLFSNGAQLEDASGCAVGWTRDMSAVTTQGSVAGYGQVAVTNGQVLDWRIWHDNVAARTVTWDHLSWWIRKVR